MPTFENREPTIQPPPDTTTTTTTPTTITTEAPAVESDEATGESLLTGADDDGLDTAEADQAESGQADADQSGAGDEPAATDTPVEASSSTTTTTPTTTAPLLQLGELEVVVVNGTEAAGVATRGSGLLEDAGYVDVGSFDGAEIFDVTVVFATGGVQSEAERLAEELGIVRDLIFPLDTAPEVSGLGDEVQLMVYVGRDVHVLPFFN